MRPRAGLALLLVFCVGCGTVSYDRLVNRKLRRVLGEQSRDYQWLSYPVTNFGVLTAYDRIGTKVGDVTDKHFICDTWSCLGISPDAIAPDQRLSINNFVAVAAGPPITLTEEGRFNRSVQVSALDLFAAVPELAAELSGNRILLSQVRCDRIWRRVLRRDPFVQAMAERPDTDALKRAFTSGRLVLVIGDIVIEGLSAKVSIVRESSTDLDLDLTTKLASAGFAVKRSGNLVFEIKASEPVVAARLLARVPGDQVAVWERGRVDWSDWLAPRGDARPIGALAGATIPK